MENSKFPIASWDFDMWPGLVPVDPLQPMLACKAWFAAADKCVSFLEKYRLLNVTNVKVEGWCRVNRDSEADDYWISKVSEVQLNVSDRGNLLEKILEDLTYEEQDGELVVPMRMLLLGETVVNTDESVLAAVTGIASVELSYSYEDLVGDFVVNVMGGWWLPYSLDGKHVNPGYEDIAGRLEKAMSEIEHTLKVDPSYEATTDYCNVDIYRLNNFRRDDGIVIGIDEYGHCLPG